MQLLASLAVLLVVLARKCAGSCRAWLLTLIASLAIAGGGQWWISKHRTAHAAEDYAQHAETSLRQLPWPDNDEELARLIAAFHALERGAAWSLNRLYSVRQMHLALREPAPQYASVGEAMATQEDQHKQPGRRGPRNAEFDALQERALQAILEVSVPAPVDAWPEELADSPPGQGARYVGEGVWAAQERDVRSPSEVLTFPIRIVNRGGAPMDDEQGPVLFYSAQQPAPVSWRPYATVGCAHVVVRHLAPGQSRLYRCELRSAMRAQQTLEERIEWVKQLRAGALQAWVRPVVGVEYAGWRAPEVQPLNAEDVERYRMLKQQDQRYAERMQRWSQS